jgi:hypothetical protein
MRKRQRSRELEQVNLLELAPVRLATWEEVDERVVIERPRASGGFGDRLRYWLAVRRIRLDECGSFAWRGLDGTQTVAQIAEALRHEFGEQVEPAEERAGQLVRLLHREGLLAYPGWDEGNLR